MTACADQQYRSRQLEILKRIRPARVDERELHLNRLIGIDVRSESLLNALRNTSPATMEEDDPYSKRDRWEELNVEIWKGDGSIMNPTFIGIEGIISSEVIEHLPEEVLPKFSQTLFDYKPKIIVVSTPNHSFNPYFVASSCEEEAENRFPDPTGRTSRIFRDDDHKFEWTEEEFQNWANELASKNHYLVEFSGVGSLVSYYNNTSSKQIPFPPPSLSAHPSLSQLPTSLALPENPHKFFATQSAIFHRISIPPAVVIPPPALSPPPPEHRLLRTYYHPPSPPPIITSASSETYNFLNSLSSLFLYHQEPRLTLSTIWYSDSPSGTVLRSKSEGRIGGIIEMLLGRMERLGEEETDWEIKTRFGESLGDRSVLVSFGAG